jgi:hypothetical protein
MGQAENLSHERQLIRRLACPCVRTRRILFTVGDRDGSYENLLSVCKELRFEMKSDALKLMISQSYVWRVCQFRHPGSRIFDCRFAICDCKSAPTDQSSNRNRPNHSPSGPNPENSWIRMGCGPCVSSWNTGPVICARAMAALYCSSVPTRIRSLVDVG